MSSPDSPDEPEMSQAEKTEAAAAGAQWDYYKSTYAPLEGDYLAAAQEDHSARAGAQATAATMRSATPSLQAIGAGGGSNRATGTMARALSGARGSAEAAEQQTRDARTTGALGVGRKLATDTTSSMASLGRMGAQTAISDMENELLTDASRSAAINQVAGSLAGAGAYGYSQMGGTPVQTDIGSLTPKQISTAGTKSQLVWRGR